MKQGLNYDILYKTYIQKSFHFYKNVLEILNTKTILEFIHYIIHFISSPLFYKFCLQNIPKKK